jgi:DNA-binding MarR family transcriptional regulator
LLFNNDSLLPSELAAMEKITNQSMSQILSHLLELGLIVRTNSETDKRKVSISLSEQGRQTFLQVQNERDEWLAKAIIATCTDEEQELLKKALKPLTKIVDYK